MMVGSQEGDVEKIYTERLLRTPFYFEIESHPEQFLYLAGERAEKHSKYDQLTHIAINSKVMKLSSRLIAICQQLNEEFPAMLNFHFFPGEVGIYDDGLSAKLKNLVPNSTIYAAANYASFLRNIDKCDLALAAFPFGNTNSTVDTHLLKIPVIAHYGPEMGAQTDKLVLSSLGYSSRHINETDNDYLEAAKLLIREIRAGEYCSDLQDDHQGIVGRITSNEEGSHYFRDLVKTVYLKHDQIVESEIRSVYWQKELT